MNQEAPITLTVPEAGRRYFGLSRNAAYDAAKRGDLPVVRVGKLLRAGESDEFEPAEARPMRAAKPRRFCASWTIFPEKTPSTPERR